MSGRRTTGNRGTVAGGTHLRVLASQRGRIEAWPVGIETPATLCRVAGKAVALRMAGNAALQILAGGLSMTQEEDSLGIVITAVELPLSAEPALDVAVGAELARVVAVTAGGLSRVGRRGVAGEEPRRVIARCRIGRIGTVTVETLGAHVTPLARCRPSIGDGTVGVGEVQAVRCRPSSPDIRPFSSPRSSDREGLYCPGFFHVAGETALLGMAGGAGGRGFARKPTVAGQELRVLMGCGGLQFGRVGGGPRIGPESLDDWHLGSIHMALGAKLTGMASSAGARDLPITSAAAAGQPAMQIQGKIRPLM